MTTNRRLMTPVTASVVAGLVVALATIGGAISGGDRAAEAKGDRFAAVHDTLCADQQWPNIANECLVWSEGAEGTVRIVTVASTDRDAAITTLTRLPAQTEAF